MSILRNAHVALSNLRVKGPMAVRQLMGEHVREQNSYSVKIKGDVMDQNLSGFDNQMQTSCGYADIMWICRFM